MALPADRLFEFIKREGPELFTGAHAVYTPQPLVEEMLAQIDVKNKTILVLFNVEFVISLVYTYKVDPTMITLYIDHENKVLLAKKMGVNFITSLDVDMKFDVAIGNPPYQDGSKDGGQNKIYNQISKQVLGLIKPDGTVSLVTPTSVLKKSKRFSLINQPGLKIVNFTADNHFNVGIDICQWVIDKTYSGPVAVKHDGGTVNQPSDVAIYDYSKTDKEFAALYNALKKITDTPDKRMFKQNAVATDTGRSLIIDANFKYPVYKIHNGSCTLVQYNKPTPKFHKKLKFIISMTKGFSDLAIVVDTKDYDVAHLCTDITDNSQIENIKSFIFSEYFINHSLRWKELDGYGYNYALKHLPPFDKSKKWNNDEVKQFLESFLHAN